MQMIGFQNVDEISLLMKFSRKKSIDEMRTCCRLQYIHYQNVKYVQNNNLKHNTQTNGMNQIMDESGRLAPGSGHPGRCRART
jgi:hypothetical protein